MTSAKGEIPGVAANRLAVGLMRGAMIASLLLVSACMTPQAPLETSPASFERSEYKLGPADKLRMIVFGEDTLTGEYVVSPTGQLALPLIGQVEANDKTVSELKASIEAKYRDGYLRQPNVSLEVLNFRPYYILGEINKPSEFPFTADLTVGKAVATAGGYTYRADTTRVYVRHSGEDVEHAYPMNSAMPVAPGDTVRIAERRF